MSSWTINEATQGRHVTRMQILITMLLAIAAFGIYQLFKTISKIKRQRRRRDPLRVGEFVAVLSDTGAVAIHGFILAVPKSNPPHDDCIFLVQLDVSNPSQGCIGLLREQIRRI